MARFKQIDLIRARIIPVCDTCGEELIDSGLMRLKEGRWPNKNFSDPVIYCCKNGHQEELVGRYPKDIWVPVGQKINYHPVPADDVKRIKKP